MSNSNQITSLPSLEEFLAAPMADVAKVSPATLIFAAGGTRRSAILANVSLQSDAYAHWSRQKMMACFELLFQHGVSHIFTFAIVESQLQEVTGVYRQQLLDWVDWGLAGPKALDEYARLGWRVRMLGTESLPALNETAARLVEKTAPQSAHTVWWSVVPSLDAPWEWIFTAVHNSQAHTRQQAIRALYGEDIPLATLFLSFGKPFISPALIPPLLADQVHCYWTQKPGYELTQEAWRTILYDYAYLRATWQEDKTGRAESILAHRSAWEHGPTLGLGKRLGAFWYPQSFPESDGILDGNEPD